MATFIDDAEPLQAAVQRISRKTPIGALLGSAEWEGVPLAMRERAFWTAHMASADIVGAMHEEIGRGIQLLSSGGRLVNRGTFITDMRERLRAAGYVPPDGKAGTLQDHMSAGRLALIYDMNVRGAQEFAAWKAGQDDGALLMYPAQELYRESVRRVPRGSDGRTESWPAKWDRLGGPERVGGKMIALKNDRIWAKLSRFGVPWPPFDYRSGMGVRDIGRAEAIERGLVKKGARAPQTPARIAFNDGLQASVANLPKAVRARLQGQFGGRVDVRGDVVKWKAQPGHDFSFLFSPASPTGNAANKVAMKATNLALGELHDLPAGPIIPMSDRMSLADADGEYWPKGTIQQKIGVREPQTATGAFAQVHEAGHYLDELLSGPGGGFASESLADADVVRVMHAITQSAGYADAVLLDATEGRLYWSMRVELFARAYAQWAATKSAHKGMLAELALRQSAPGMAWEAADFAPIQAAFEDLFSGRRLTR